MDLNRVAAAVVSAVTPRTELTLRQSTGSVVNGDGSRTPTYAPDVTCWGSVQALGYKDIQQVSSLNLQGTRRAIYLEGNWSGLVRAGRQGGDLIALPDGTMWLVALVLEHWNDWTKVAATLQTDAPAPPGT